MKRLYWLLAVLALVVFAGVWWSVTGVERRIRRVERVLVEDARGLPWEGIDLAERMAHYNVPGVSIAVINDFEIEWARGYGAVEAGGDIPVTPDTLFQTASMGKVIVAAATMRYVERRELDLDQDVNERLISWRVPENEFTTQERVTLRRLLSHSAGLPVVDVVGYAQGELVPTLQQVLDGEPPANSIPVRVVAVPGSRYEYSNGGYLIIQQLLMDLEGRPFPEIMREQVLDPVGMNATTFEAPLPEELWEVASSGHRSNGAPIPGRWHTYPEMGPGGGTWSTPSDMASLLIEIMRAYNGHSNPLFSQDTANQMLTRQIDTRGLGPVVLDDGGDLFYFMHPGANEGFKGVMAAYPQRGQGIVIMTSSDNGDLLYDEILRSASVAYGWTRDYTLLGVAIVLGMAGGVAWYLVGRRRRVHGVGLAV